MPPDLRSRGHKNDKSLFSCLMGQSDLERSISVRVINISINLSLTLEWVRLCKWWKRRHAGFPSDSARSVCGWCGSLRYSGMHCSEEEKWLKANKKNISLITTSIGQLNCYNKENMFLYNWWTDFKINICLLATHQRTRE